MNATTAAVDLAKNVFQIALADASHRVIEQHRLTRPQFERFFANHGVRRIVMEACGTAHHFARTLAAAASLAKGNEVTGVRRWALDVQLRSNHNKATCALANKMARIRFGVLRDQTPFGQPTTRLGKKVTRQSFEIAV